MYVTYQELRDAKPLQLFVVLMTGAACEWLESLADTNKDTLAHLQTAFIERYQTPEIVKCKSARDIFFRRQQNLESVDDIVCSMLRLARVFDMDIREQMYTIMSGLKPHIAAYITQKKPKDIQELTEHAHVAELTCPSNSVLSTETVQTLLSDLQLEIKRLSSKLDTSSASVMAGPTRSTTPEGRRLLFDTTRRASSPMRTYESTTPRRDDIPSRMAREATQIAAQRYEAGGPAIGQQSATTTTPGCHQRCGSRYCTNPLYCQFINMTCYYCQKVGHVQRVCRQRRRDQSIKY